MLLDILIMEIFMKLVRLQPKVARISLPEKIVPAPSVVKQFKEMQQFARNNALQSQRGGK